MTVEEELAAAKEEILLLKDQKAAADLGHLVIHQEKGELTAEINKFEQIMVFVRDRDPALYQLIYDTFGTSLPPA